MNTLTRKEIQILQNGKWINVPVLITGGSGLPDVDASDNGKIPQVIDGEWVMSLDTKNQLDQISVYLGSVESLTWAQRMAYVRNGQGRDMFPVGTQFNTSHDLLGNILWDVVAHDHFANPNSLGGHTMTLMTHYMIYDKHRCWSHSNTIYTASEVLPAGNYSFVIKNRTTLTNDNNKRVYFTLQNAIPVGGQIRPLDLKYNKTYNGGKAGVFASNLATEASEEITFTMTPITGAINLGDAGTGNLNNSGCADNGNTDYDISDVRQWLNSDADDGEWWKPQNPFASVGYLWESETDGTIKNWMTTEPGFMHGLDTTFMQYVCEVDYPCGTSQVYSVNHVPLDTYNVRDKFTLPTSVEVGAAASRDSLEIGRCLEFFANVDNTKRIKYRGPNESANTSWSLRNPKTISGTANALRAIKTTGAVDGCSASGASGFVIMCTLA